MPAGLLEEIKSLFTPPVPWDVELARWMDAHVPLLRDPLRTLRPRQPPAVLDAGHSSSGPVYPAGVEGCLHLWRCDGHLRLDGPETLGRALGAIASYSEARDVPAVRLVMCDAAPYDRGMVAPTELRGIYPCGGPWRHRAAARDQPPAFARRLSTAAPIMIITDGWCEEELLVPRDHCFVLPRKTYAEGAIPLRTSAPVFRVLK